MKGFEFTRSALFVAVAGALLAGCGGLQGASAPVGGSSAVAGSPVRNAVPKLLLYITDVKNASVYYYEYPGGKNLIGTLTGFGKPMGACADSAGNVWITDATKQQIVEYEHGGSSPIATLSDSGFEPYACAVDPKTGDLAVSNQGLSDSEGNVAIYPGGSGSATTYTDKDIHKYYFITYDKNGNLFVDGDSPVQTPQMAELVAGGSKLENLTSDKELPKAGSLQWESTALIIGYRHREPGLDHVKIERFSLTGKDLKLKGSGPLNKVESVEQLVLNGPTLIAADGTQGKVALYRYPKTGAPFNEITGLGSPFGLAMSIVK